MLWAHWLHLQRDKCETKGWTMRYGWKCESGGGSVLAKTCVCVCVWVCSRCSRADWRVRALRLKVCDERVPRVSESAHTSSRYWITCLCLYDVHGATSFQHEYNKNHKIIDKSRNSSKIIKVVIHIISFDFHKVRPAGKWLHYAYVYVCMCVCVCVRVQNANDWVTAKWMS